MISPELYVVQDRVQDLALNLTWFRVGVGVFTMKTDVYTIMARFSNT
jgi:hypothetical protein